MTRPTDAVRNAVSSALAAQRAAPGALALVACSGGPDSTALAAAARQASDTCGWRVGAVVVDHGLQQGSPAVAAAAAGLCHDLGLHPVVAARVEVGSRGEGPEAAARAARYGAFAESAAQTGAAAVLLAHTLDDQAETVLLGLARGSGARSLAGMPDAAPLPRAAGVVLLRPLLGVTRQVLAQAGRDWGLPVWHDPHNDDSAFARVRVRRSVMPALSQALGPGVPQALARTAALLRDDDAALSVLADAVLADLTAADGSRGVECGALAGQPPAIRRRVLHRLLLSAGVPAARVTAEHLYRLDRMVTGQGRTGSMALPGGVSATRRCGRLELA